MTGVGSIAGSIRQQAVTVLHRRFASFCHPKPGINATEPPRPGRCRVDAPSVSLCETTETTRSGRLKSLIREVSGQSDVDGQE
jgi:hypothetical protein